MSTREEVITRSRHVGRSVAAAVISVGMVTIGALALLNVVELLG